MTGIEMVAVYSLDLFERAKLQHNHYALSIITMNCCTAGYLVSATYLSKRVPRKVHFIVSGLLLAINWMICGIILRLAVNFILNINFFKKHIFK